MDDDNKRMNVLGEELEPCSMEPLTGFLRDGCCSYDPRDPGAHVVCAQVTDEFLQYSKDKGNDLITPQPEQGFPGLKAGDRWCLCATRWEEAKEDGVAPPILLKCTDSVVLEMFDFKELQEHAIDLS